MSTRPAVVRVLASAAVALVLVATGVAAYRLRDADPRPAVLTSHDAMQVAPAWAHPGESVLARFTTSRSRYGFLALVSPAGSYLVDGAGRLNKIPSGGRFTINSAGLRARSVAAFTVRLPATLPPGRYRACSLDSLTAGPNEAECALLTVLDP